VSEADRWPHLHRRSRLDAADKYSILVRAGTENVSGSRGREETREPRERSLPPSLTGETGPASIFRPSRSAAFAQDLHFPCRALRVTPEVTNYPFRALRNDNSLADTVRFTDRRGCRA